MNGELFFVFWMGGLFILMGVMFHVFIKKVYENPQKPIDEDTNQ
jgi:hypothetical protein